MAGAAAWAPTKRWADSWLLNFSCFRSRRRIGRWLFSALLFARMPPAPPKEALAPFDQHLRGPIYWALVLAIPSYRWRRPSARDDRSGRRDIPAQRFSAFGPLTKRLPRT